MNEEKKIVGIGYNGMPNGCHDDVLPWSRDSEDWLETKYPYGEFIKEKGLLVSVTIFFTFFNEMKDIVSKVFHRKYSCRNTRHY